MPARRRAALARGGDRAAQLGGKGRARHFEKIQARFARARIEVGRHLAAELNDLHLVVDDQARRTVFRRHEPIRFLRAHPAGSRPRGDAFSPSVREVVVRRRKIGAEMQMRQRMPAIRPLEEDPVLRIERAEEIADARRPSPRCRAAASRAASARSGRRGMSFFCSAGSK